MQHLLQFMAEQVSVLFERKVQGLSYRILHVTAHRVALTLFEYILPFVCFTLSDQEGQAKQATQD